MRNNTWSNGGNNNYFVWLVFDGCGNWLSIGGKIINIREPPFEATKYIRLIVTLPAVLIIII